jgi:hypothetical protein
VVDKFPLSPLPRCPECGVNLASEPHECPYATEIHNDYKLCTCCSECEHYCEMEI